MAQTKLLKNFPMIRTREQILLEIRSDPAHNQSGGPEDWVRFSRKAGRLLCS